jgi:tetratricopeptide (TPR) repeat protein
VAYHPHGRLLAAIDEESTFRVWELASAKKVAEFGGSRRNLASGGEELDSQHQAAPRMARLAYSPDGQRLVLSTRLRPPEIWDAVTGRLALILDRSVDGADYCAFTSDGRRLYAGLGAQVRVWNTDEQTHEERLKIAQQHAIAWHRRWYPICRKESNWPACALHLKSLVEANPKSGAYREELGEALGYLGQLAQARVENDKAIELGRRTFLVFYNRACLSLEAGDLTTYRQACLDAHEKLPVNDDPYRANWVVWISCIHPEAPGSPTALLELADLALEKKPDDYAIRNTRGAALYRVGLYREAIRQLQASIEVHETKQGNAIDWAFLALAHARLGELEQARSWLEKARTSPPLGDWQQQIEIRSLLQEAADAVSAAADASSNS